MNIRNRGGFIHIVVFIVAIAIGIAMLLMYQSMGETPIRGSNRMPPSSSR